MFFLYGIGSNGKSTLLNTVASVLGDYYKSAPIEIFTITHGEKHPTDLAALRAARFVIASETEEGQRWAESRIKDLTGGDPITARFMRQDSFTYLPQFKLFFSGNHKPGLRTVNEAIRRRLNLVPFKVVISAAKRDKALPEKLKQESAGILAWMIKGCLEWQANGLMPPATVETATDDYLMSENVIDAWIEDCCVRDPESHVPTHALYDSWKRWAEPAGYYVGSEKWFGSKLEDAGFRYERKRHGDKKFRGFWGLRIVQVVQERMPF